MQSTLNINGYPVLVSDTAGIRKEGFENVVEKEGIRRSLEEAENADLTLLVLDIRDILSSVTSCSNSDVPDIIQSYCEDYKRHLGIDSFFCDRKHIVVANKWDLLGTGERNLLKEFFDTSEHMVAVSCKTEEGIPRMLTFMSTHFQQL